MQHGAADFNQSPFLNRLVAFDGEHAAQHQVRLMADKAKGGGISGLECQAHQRAGVQRAVMIRIDRQNQAMSKRDVGHAVG